MKTVNEYIKLPYRMEIIPDKDEGGYVVSFRNFPAARQPENLWKRQLRMPKMPKERGLRPPWKMAFSSMSLSNWKIIPDNLN